MKIGNQLKITEVVLLVLVWTVLLAAPVFFRSEESLNWLDLLKPIETLLPLLVIFLINRFVLVPNLLLKKKRVSYLLSVLGVIAIFSIGSYFMYPRKQSGSPARPARNERVEPPPHVRERGGEFPPPPQQPPRNRPIPPFANLLLFSILLVGFDTGLMTSLRLINAEKERAKLEKENAETQLAFLRNQVSPHFFMNTLNNIHALIDIDSEEAKESVIRLSKLMRHLLYDSEKGLIPLQKEIEFIQNYVDLMKLRFSDKVRIELNLPAEIPDKNIPPLLFTSFVENAFKHGISYQQESFVEITFFARDDRLNFEIRNSQTQNPIDEEDSGIGIENARKRLDLLYGKDYTLSIEDMKEEFFVSLSIPI